MAVLTYPTHGPHKSWDLSEDQLKKWSELFPQVDVLAECRHALAWIEAHSPKTARGMPVFLVGWLGRAKKDRIIEKSTTSWNHDRLPPPKSPIPPASEGDRRRSELWRQCEAEGMDKPTAKATSYERWLAEGWGSR